MTAKEFIDQVGDEGKIFTVTFVKRTTGELRRMNCRFGVKKGVKGVGLAYNPKDYNLIGVYDMQAHGFRMIAVDGIKEIVGNGQRWISE